MDELLAVILAWGFAPSHPADLNGDDHVDVDDLVAVLTAWGPCDS